MECVKDVLGKMGAGQGRDDVLDVVRLINKAGRRENTEREATGVNSMATEKRSLTVVYMNCEGVRKEENILKLEYIKRVVRRALDDGLGVMIGGDMNAQI